MEIIIYTIVHGERDDRETDRHFAGLEKDVLLPGKKKQRLACGERCT